MIRLSLQIRLLAKMGIHLCSAAQLARLIGGFHCRVTVSKDGRSADGRSVIQLLTLGAFCGSVLSFSAEGDDAHQTVEAILGLLKEWEEQQNGRFSDSGSPDLKQ